MDLSSHSEKQILEGCISLIQEMVDGFRDYLDYIGHDEPEYEEEKQPFHMSYFHIVLSKGGCGKVKTEDVGIYGSEDKE